MDINQLNLSSVIDQVGKEKNIDREILVSALEAAMLSAARKKLGLNADLEARFNEEIGEVEVYEFKRIVKDVLNPATEIALNDALKLDANLTEEAIGEDLGIKLDSKDLGRIAAQNAKQIIVQRVREAERSVVFEEYKDRKDELITGTVRRFERGSMIVDLGRAEAVVPVREQVSKENVRVGDRLVAYVLDVMEASRGAQIVLSRTHPNLVVRLFEQEVPEIAEGIVSIESVAREPGFRTKIAVRSKDSDVDPVGACVGMKGARVQAVVAELRGEKIDIVPFDQDDARFVCNALAPAEVTRVLVNEGDHRMQIVVPDDQLSLAIGRRGQNVRLAAELTGWKIDISSETKVAEERALVSTALLQIDGITEFQIQTLYNHGFRQASDLAYADEALLENIPGIEKDQIARIKASALQIAAAEKKAVSTAKSGRTDAKAMAMFDELQERLSEEGKEDNLALSVLGLSEDIIEKLSDASYLDLGDIAFDDSEAISSAAGISQELASEIHSKAIHVLAELTHGALQLA